MSVRMTSMAACAGCAAKFSPRDLARLVQPVSGMFAPADFPQLLVGISEPDDAAVYELNPEQAIISTVDFFPPVVDDPYSFGAIAAANALSDVYAMGGDPLFAVNLAAFPDNVELSVLSEILRGGADKVREAGAVIAGGHTIADQEPKYGLAVTGVVHPSRILHKGGARPGDVLILTKLLGTGTITTALKREIVEPGHLQAAVTSMSRLNRHSSEIARHFDVHAMTDVTGFSFLGHAHEMAHLSGVDFSVSPHRFQWIDGALEYAEQGVFPGGQARNRAYYSAWVDTTGSPSPVVVELLYDPQTSGGLLISVNETEGVALLQRLTDAGEPAFIVGHAMAGTGRICIEG